MSIISQDLAPHVWSSLQAAALDDGRQPGLDRCLARLRSEAHVVAFDDTSRFVFFSDCHRGDRGRTDAFAPNEALFLHALTHYARQGFTYVEVGDGDELWQNRRFEQVRSAHALTFDLLHRLDRENRLYLLLGNHDMRNGRVRQMDKDGLLVREGLCLTHAKSGQRILVFHGHQADLHNDRLFALSRYTVRYLWRQMLILGLVKGISWTEDPSQRHPLDRCIIDRVRVGKERIERRLTGWARRQEQTIICGHTHHPLNARCGTAAYFNTGSCVEPYQITGLEIDNGAIAQIRWIAERGQVQRELMTPFRRLSRFA